MRSKWIAIVLVAACLGLSGCAAADGFRERVKAFDEWIQGHLW